MKKIVLAFIAIGSFLNVVHAQSDAMYIMKDGAVIDKIYVNTQIDSVVFYKPIETSGTLTDARDGKVYKWVAIGNQIWMAENLAYLPSVVGPKIGSKTTAYYYVLDYDGIDVIKAKDQSNYEKYGVFYNWTAAMAGSASSMGNPSMVQGVCPTGWHLPSDAEWAELTAYLGGDSIAGGKLKETGTTHWNANNTGATNETGFTALPAGNRSVYGQFVMNRFSGLWWSATEYKADRAWIRSMYCRDKEATGSAGDKDAGLSVRCVKD